MSQIRDLRTPRRSWRRTPSLPPAFLTMEREVGFIAVGRRHNGGQAAMLSIIGRELRYIPLSFAASYES